jgi:hypothetical protein
VPIYQENKCIKCLLAEELILFSVFKQVTNRAFKNELNFILCPENN